MIRVNLLKPEKKEIKERPAFPLEEAKEKKRPSNIGNLILLLFIILIGALLFLQSQAIHNEQNLLLIAQEEKGKLSDVISKLESLEKQKASFERKINLITQLRAQQEIPIRILDDLSRSLPEWVWLTEATYENLNIKISGKALSNTLIADFISNLENSPYFHSVNLISSTLRTIGNTQVFDFSLTALYEVPAPSQQTPSAQQREEKK